MDSSATHQASPLCLDLTFPSGATEEKEKKEQLKGFWEFFVMSPSRQCVCIHISDPGRDKDKYMQHTQMYTHKHIFTFSNTHTHTHTLTHTHTASPHPPTLSSRCRLQSSAAEEAQSLKKRGEKNNHGNKFEAISVII